MRERISSLGRSLKIPITRIGEILPKKNGLRIAVAFLIIWYPDTPAYRPRSRTINNRPRAGQVGAVR